MQSLERHAHCCSQTSADPGRSHSARHCRHTAVKQQQCSRSNCRHNLQCRCSQNQPGRTGSSCALELDALSRRALFATAAVLAQLQDRAVEAAASKGGSSAIIAGGATTLSNSGSIVKLSPSEKQVLETNKRVQAQNSAPKEFPSFVRRGYAIRVIADGYTEDEQGLIFKDFQEGSGPAPLDGQEVVFNYTAYNESGARIDSSYQKKRPAQTRLGIQGLIPGFEAGIKTMSKGGQRRIVVPPELGPPTGPSTFFSAKQCEVFDVELLDIRTCKRRQVAFFSDVVCE